MMEKNACHDENDRSTLTTQRIIIYVCMHVLVDYCATFDKYEEEENVDEWWWWWTKKIQEEEAYNQGDTKGKLKW